MANTKTAKANILVNERNRQRNVNFKSRMRTWFRKALTAITAKSEDRESVARQALRIIDKTFSKGIIKRNTAARQKSRLAKALVASMAPSKSA